MPWSSRLNDKLLWQQFTYEEILEICYVCEKIGQPLDAYYCAVAQEVDSKQVYGP